MSAPAATRQSASFFALAVAFWAAAGTFTPEDLSCFVASLVCFCALVRSC
jgi:hypothetical protein